MVQTSLPVDPVTKEDDTEDDDLDIPAFLRRQAN
jgi:cell division protein FtsZ